MKNLRSLVGGCILTGSLTLAGFNSQAQFNKVTYNETSDFVEIAGKKEKDDKCSSASIIVKKDKIYLINQINENKAVQESVTINEDNTLNYILLTNYRSLDECKWGYDTKFIRQIYNASKEDFPEEQKERIKYLFNLNTHCTGNWKEFLKREAEEYSGQSFDKEINYSMILYNFNEDGFPKSCAAWMAVPGKGWASRIEYSDKDNDGNYDWIRVQSSIAEEKKTDVIYKKENGDIRYFANHPEITDLVKKPEEFSPQQKERINEILHVEIDCTNNELLPLLYKEYERWKAEQ